MKCLSRESFSTNLSVYQANLSKYTILQTCLDQNRKTAYDLIASHGDVENLIFFAMLMQGVSLRELDLV